MNFSTPGLTAPAHERSSATGSCRRHNLHQGTVAAEVGVEEPIGRGKIRVLLDGIALVALGFECKKETTGGRVKGLNRHRNRPGDHEVNAGVAVSEGQAAGDAYVRECARRPLSTSIVPRRFVKTLPITDVAAP